MLHCFRSIPGNSSNCLHAQEMEASRLQTTTPAFPASQFHQKVNISFVQLKTPKRPTEQERTHQVHLLHAPPLAEPQHTHSADSQPCAFPASPWELPFWRSPLRCSRVTLPLQTGTDPRAGASKGSHSPSRRCRRSPARPGEPVGQRGAAAHPHAWIPRLARPPASGRAAAASLPPAPGRPAPAGPALPRPSPARLTGSGAQAGCASSSSASSARPAMVLPGSAPSGASRSRGHMTEPRPPGAGAPARPDPARHGTAPPGQLC